VLHILTHQSFDIIDLLLAEIDDVITDGMGVAKQLPYGHWISYICSRIAPNVQRFPTYRPTVPHDPRQGYHVLRAALDRLQPEAHVRVQGEGEVLFQAEVGLPEDLVWSDSDSSEEGDADFFPDPEGGSSEPVVQSSVPSPPPTVSEAQVTQPTELTGLLQQLIQQQREDKLVVEEARRAAEEARRASEARFAQLQQEAARDRATADERFAGLLDRVTQR
jgi:hypothetical protein